MPHNFYSQADEHLKEMNLHLVVGHDMLQVIHFLTESGAKTTAENISRAYVNCPDDYFSVLGEVKKACKKLADDEILILSGDEFRITSETQQRIFEMMNNIDIANYRIKGEITKQVKQLSLVRGAQNLTIDSVNVGFAVQSDSGEPLSTGGVSMLNTLRKKRSLRKASSVLCLLPTMLLTYRK